MGAQVPRSTNEQLLHVSRVSSTTRMCRRCSRTAVSSAMRTSRYRASKNISEHATLAAMYRQPASCAVADRRAQPLRPLARARRRRRGRRRARAAPAGAARSMISSASSGVGLHDVAALVLAEPGGVRRQLALVGEQLRRRCSPASAISATATSRPPSLTSCTAATLPSRISARTRLPALISSARSTGGGAPSSLPVDDLLVERLAEVARLAADQRPAGRPRA